MCSVYSNSIPHGPSIRTYPLALSFSRKGYQRSLATIDRRKLDIAALGLRVTAILASAVAKNANRACVTLRIPVIVLCWGGIIVRITGHCVSGGFDMPMPWGEI
jgi:hypothetical protein